MDNPAISNTLLKKGSPPTPKKCMHVALPALHGSPVLSCEPQGKKPWIQELQRTRYTRQSWPDENRRPAFCRSLSRSLPLTTRDKSLEKTLLSLGFNNVTERTRIPSTVSNIPGTRKRLSQYRSQKRKINRKYKIETMSEEQKIHVRADQTRLLSPASSEAHANLLMWRHWQLSGSVTQGVCRFRG